MQFGQKKTSISSTLSLIDKYYAGKVSLTVVQYTDRIRVNTVQEEAAEFLNFSNKLRELREKNQLTYDTDDKTTLPSFRIQYPKEKTKDDYFVILSWCETVVESA